MRRLLVLALALGAAAPAAAASSSRVQVDARIELLGVVQYLASGARDKALDAGYQEDVERRFGSLRKHPAVALYRRAARRPGGEGLGILLLYFSGPPELKLKRGELPLPYVDSEEDKQLAHRFLWELRDFAAASGFERFFREHRAFYETLESSATATLGGLDPVVEIESYLRVSLDSRNHYVLSPLYRAGRWSSFILPYPDPVTLLERPSAPIDVYTLFTWVPAKAERSGQSYPVFDVPSAILWQEPLYVFIDASFHHYEASRVSDPGQFYGETAAGCRQRAINCVKGYTIGALVDRLSRRAWKTPLLPTDPDPVLRRYTAALSSRLERYEAGAGTLWEFYPELFGVFVEVGRSGAPVPAAHAPLLPIRSAADFFDPKWRLAFAERK